MHWQISRRQLQLDRTLVMAILNVTPDSFSDGGQFLNVDDALKQAEKLIDEGADILDIGGESTRPGSRELSVEEEIRRVAPVIEGIAKRFEIPISIDTWKSAVASCAIDAGGEIINDISGLRWDAEIAQLAAKKRTGLVLMHSRGDFATMHSPEPVDDIYAEVCEGFRHSVDTARNAGVDDDQIVLDVGLGFGKTFEQNLHLIAKLDKIVDMFPTFPMLVGASRKSFIGKILAEPDPAKRIDGSVAAAVIAVWNGAKIVRVHDVQQTVNAVRIVEAIATSGQEKHP
jgi:dihydropteroate synthase